MRVIKVPVDGLPEVIEIENELQAMYDTIGCEYIEAVYPFEDMVAIVCDEEGKLNGSEPNRYLQRKGIPYDLVFNNFLIVGLSDDDFDSVPEILIDKYVEKFSNMFVEVDE